MSRCGMRLELYRDLDGQHRWRLLAGNGRVVCASSEGFCSRSGARRNAELTASGLGHVLGADTPRTR